MFIEFRSKNRIEEFSLFCYLSFMDLQNEIPFDTPSSLARLHNEEMDGWYLLRHTGLADRKVSYTIDLARSQTMEYGEELERWREAYLDHVAREKHVTAKNQTIRNRILYSILETDVVLKMLDQVHLVIEDALDSDGVLGIKLEVEED